MRDVNFIIVADNAGTNVATAGLDAWEVTEGIALANHGYAKSTGMNLRGGFITARIKGSKATKSDKNYPTGAEILNALNKQGDVKVHFGNSSRSSLYLSWKEYQAAPGYTDVLIKQVTKLAGAAFGDLIPGKSLAGIVWNYGEMTQKVTGTAAGKLGMNNAAVNFLAGKDTPVQFYISGRKHGGDFTEIKKKRRIVSFEQIAGLLAGSNIADQKFKELDGGDTEDVLSKIDGFLGV
ncbi:MAG: hypothetical protein O3A63_02885 [Proteobacteria bacterium]|nr:hypothetical protein [Pseudomonadota bacterium]